MSTGAIKKKKKMLDLVLFYQLYMLVFKGIGLTLLYVINLHILQHQ